LIRGTETERWTGQVSVEGSLVRKGVASGLELSAEGLIDLIARSIPYSPPVIERRRRDLLTPLLAALVVILVLAFRVFEPFLLVIAVAGCVALLMAPLHRHLAHVMGGRSGFASLLLVAATTVVILVPVGLSILALGQRALGFFAWIGPRLAPEELERLWRETLPRRFPVLETWTSHLEGQLAPVVSSALNQAVAAATTALQKTVAGFAIATFDLLLFLLVLFPAARRRACARPCSRCPLPQTGRGGAHLRPPGPHVKGPCSRCLWYARAG
jgi:hypothetical protein